MLGTFLLAFVLGAPSSLAPSVDSACAAIHGPMQRAMYCGQFSGPPSPPSGGLPDTRVSCGFWMAASGGSDTGTGSSASPFASFTKMLAVLEAAQAGNKVACLKAGTYSGASLTLTSTDSSETWETDPASPVNSAILNGNGSTPTAVVGNGAVGVTWNGIALTGYTAIGLETLNSSTGWMIYGNDFGGSGSGAGTGCGVGCANAFAIGAGTVARGNYIHDWFGAGPTFFAFNAGDSANGAVFDRNVVLRTCTGLSDCGAIYGDMRNTAGAGGSVTISNNFVRDTGSAANQTASHDLYFDDDSSNVTATGNILGPVASGDTHQNNSIIFMNGGFANTIQNNIIDVGPTNIVPIAGAGGCGSGGTILCSGPSAPNVYAKNIVVAGYSGSFNGNLFGDGGPFIYTMYYCTASQSNFPGTLAQWLNLSGSLYHQYGSGDTPDSAGATACGTLATDGSAQFADPQLSGYLYTLAAGSPVFGAPLNFVDVTLARNAGPPGFTIPTSSNHSNP